LRTHRGIKFSVAEVDGVVSVIKSLLGNFVLFVSLMVVSDCEADPWHSGAFSASQRVVGNALIDPGSAQWRNRVKVRYGSDNEIAVCGEVNARNAMGGYTGFTPFFSLWERAGETARHVRSAVRTAGNAAAFTADWTRYCSGTPLQRLP
jgi:hypothetical protein